jgi:hypothetical protein
MAVRGSHMTDDSIEAAVAEVADSLRVLSGEPASEKQVLSIRQFFSQGISKKELVDALSRAYAGSSVKDPWRYFCGICWRIISRTKRGAVGETVSSYGKFPWS